MIIVDSTVWVDCFRGMVNPETTWLGQNLNNSNLALTDLILCEVLQGLGDPAYTPIRKKLLSFGVHSTGGVEMALAATDNYRTLRAKGITVRKTIDCFIATFCISGGHYLLHRDRDFNPFERYLGLAVIHPA